MKGLFPFAVLVLTPCLVADDVKLPPGITKEKAAEGWIAVFDGETTYGFKTHGNVKVQKGDLVLAGGASIESTTRFGHAELLVEYRTDGEGKIVITQPKGEFRTSATEVNYSEYRDGHFGQDAPASPVRLSAGPGGNVYVRSIILRVLDTQPLFNGKDLTGWKLIPGHGSKFSVTSAGELNVKDGNGDLQTEGQWDDFILQLSVISNGDHLNSGVFFRCVPGQFWSGYEAQIRNEWETTLVLKEGAILKGSCTDKGDQIEVKAGRQTKTVAKKDIASRVDHRDKPIDYGTGGIYNLRPARRVVSTDREYFTLTVVAHGNHLAVWVNGYQTAEFTDNRQPNATARRGRKDGAGPISLQGHDPTTDLSFKNIRLVPLRKRAP